MFWLAALGLGLVLLYLWLRGWWFAAVPVQALGTGSDRRLGTVRDPAVRCGTAGEAQQHGASGPNHSSTPGWFLKPLILLSVGRQPPETDAA
jgi:hypothetical protein